MLTTTVDASRVRFAEPRDEHQLMAIIRMVHAENGIFPLSEPKARAELSEALSRRTGIIGVVGDEEKIQGAAWLCYSQDWYSDIHCLVERFVYVIPEYRRSTNTQDLIDWTKRMSAMAGAPMLIGIQSNHRTEAKVRLYQRRFGSPAGVYFVYGAAHAGSQ